MSDHLFLTYDCLIQIFSFFKEEDLIAVSSVCKRWHEAAETPWLWREMCLQQWGFCNIAVVAAADGKQPWKEYYLRRSHLEMNMAKGSTSCYSCKSLRHHTGKVVGVGYLQGNSPQLSDTWSSNATVCSASSDGTLRAWDIHKGEELWCSAAQSALTGLSVDAAHGVLVTADATGTIRTWDGKTGAETGSYASASPRCTLLQFSIDSNSYVSVGTSQGSVHTLGGPSLTKLSSVVVCDAFPANLLLASPDSRWILAGTRDHIDSSPKVISSQSVVASSEEAGPLSRCLAVSGCCAAVFLPSHPARLAAIYRQSPNANNKTLSVFDINLKKNKYKDSEILVHQVASFDLLLGSRASDVLLAARSSSTLVVAADAELRVYALTGSLLTCFTQHTAPITSIWVDGFRVVTASRDLSLHVLTWRRDGERAVTLQSRYHLLGGSHSMSRGFTKVVCDYSTIVASTEGVDGKDVLKIYSFSS